MATTAEAIRFFEARVERNPRDVLSRVTIGRLLLQRGDERGKQDEPHREIDPERGGRRLLLPPGARADALGDENPLRGEIDANDIDREEDGGAERAFGIARAEHDDQEIDAPDHAERGEVGEGEDPRLVLPARGNSCNGTTPIPWPARRGPSRFIPWRSNNRATTCFW